MLLSYNVSHTQYTHTCTKVDKRKSTSPIIGGAEITEISNAVDIYIYIQGVTGGKGQTSGGCSLC